ncbi:MAG: branched-chain amino acid ABC transporter permease [Acidimicrobiia bacterium]|nr:branched-chain amino acid ABC transporter permease [Acidimicrobiia bacterium]
MAGNGTARAYLPIVVVAAVLAAVPAFFSDSRSMMLVITTGLLFAAYTVAFNLIFGSTGQLFLCVGALAGIGGFGSAIVSDRYGIPFVLTMIGAALLAGVFGAVLSWVAVSRSLDTIFTGIVTLAFSLSFGNFVLGSRELTGGENGLPISAGGDTILGRQVAPYYVFLGLVSAYLVVYRLIQRSSVGLAFKALRDDEVAAELSGVDVARYRVLAGFAGSVMLGLAGACFAHYRGFIGDTTYSFGSVDVRVLVMLAFGGIGSLIGPIIGAVVFTVLDELLVDYAQLREVLYGVVTVTLFLSFRQGVVGAITNRWDRRRVEVAAIGSADDEPSRDGQRSATPG